MSSHNGCFQLFSLPLTGKSGGCCHCSGLPCSFGLPECIVDVVRVPELWQRVRHHEPLTFPGLFVTSIPQHCFLPTIVGGREELWMFLNSVWGSQEAVLSVCVAADCTAVGTVVRHTRLTEAMEAAPYTPNPEQASCSVLEVQPALNSLLFSASCATAPHRLALCLLPAAVSTAEELTELASLVVLSTGRGGFSISSDSLPIPAAPASAQGGCPPQVESIAVRLKSLQQQMAGMRYNILSFSSSDGSDGVSIPYECIFITPPGHYIPTLHPDADSDRSSAAGGEVSRLPGLLVVPHGGPHSAFTTAFCPQYLYTGLMLGSCVCMINYRGSVGFGRASVESLLGTVGRNDVDDCAEVVKHILRQGHSTGTGAGHQQQAPWVDEARVAIVGGSHGGFLVGHALGQYPGLFRAGCMRNPVTDLNSMVGSSDIPDWCVVEGAGGGAYDFSQYALPNLSGCSGGVDPRPLRLSEASPITHIKNVRCPLLLCLGGVDRRVPPSQGLQYYHTLRALYRKRDDSSGSKSPALKCLLFPDDCHPLDIPTTEVEHWAAIVAWFREHV
jgi:hypothetical protein